MTVNKPIWMQAAGGDPALSYSGQELREIIGAFLKTEGVLKALGVNALKVVQRAAGANFSVDVSVGHAAIQGDDAANQGYYMVKVSAVENVVTPSAPGSGTRVHRVVLQIRDKLFNGSYTTYDAVVQVLQDTGSGTPATPNSAISLALVSIASGQANVSNANITDTRAEAILVSTPSNLLNLATEQDMVTTSLTYVAAANSINGTFVAPASGNVYVSVLASVDSSGSNTFVAWEIRNNNVSGSVAVAANDNTAVIGIVTMQAQVRSLVTGLTPGNTYFIRSLIRTQAAATATAYRHGIIVEPAG